MAAFEKNQERLQVGSVERKCLRWIMAESKFVIHIFAFGSTMTGPSLALLSLQEFVGAFGTPDT